MPANTETKREAIRKASAASEKTAASYKALGEAAERASEPFRTMHRRAEIGRSNLGDTAWLIQFEREEGSA